MADNTTRWDSAEYLKTEEDMLLYLEACLEEAGDDPTFIAHALDVIARAQKRILFESIKQGLTEAIEHAAGQESEAVVHPPRPPDVKSKNKKPGDQMGLRA
ncbi:MAG: hypothetical protein OXI94_10135 [Gemmatimonadota bacterium]|nr:hypothetical protein [Gemmatimonadota bacterium]MDE2954075.1 hypothetical protein [Gemmatimonadota bacterium]